MAPTFQGTFSSTAATHVSLPHLQINLIPGPADLSEYSQNPEFYLEDFYRTLQDLHNPCCLLPVSSKFYLIRVPLNLFLHTILTPSPLQ
ncbi:hypothetical protein E2C01_100833 [Portunus trituberculatus]|uniref:Uncharacterized protein n=1 Tax=Portunus trituberculatus TaxID=210409 RepID=A0A5B7KE19_PORTR|nr:hypothetical protein [Portunus trituberculatus]